jgi:succinate dehydrogenase / fumarate reductase cytochrome b subunit
MTWILGILRSSIGRKAIMAVTGAILFAFVVGHMMGNMLLYLGPEALNAYGHRLHAMPSLLWLVRSGLMVAVGLHVLLGTLLTIGNWRARPTAYSAHRLLAATYASRTMIWGGLALALFVTYHIMHLTLGTVLPGFIAGDVYHNVVTGFRNPLVAGVYILAVGALGLHLYHGAWSMLQSVGANHPRYNPLRKALATLAALVLFAGNVSFPLAVLAGLVR